MAENETVGGASVQVGADIEPIIKELERLRKEVESRINALGFSLTGPIYLAVRGIQEAFHRLVDVIKTPFTAISASIAAVFGPAQEAMGRSLLDIEHWTAAARNAEVAQTRFNAVFAASGNVIGYTAKELANMRQNLAGRSSFGMGDIRQAQQELIQLHDVRGENFFRALELSMNLANRSGRSMADTAELIGRALVNPEHGMRRLRHEGIMLTESEQQLIKSAGMGGDVFKQQGVMLDILSGKVGNISEAMSGTATAKIARLGNAWGALGKQIWEFLVPIQGAVAEIAGTIVTTIVGAIGPTFKGFTDQTKQWADAISSFLKANKETFLTWANLGQQIIGNFVRTISGQLASLFGTSQLTGIREYWDAAIKGITTFLSWASSLSGSLSQVWEVLKLEMEGLWEDFKAAAARAWNSLPTSFEPIFKYLGELLYTVLHNAIELAVDQFEKAVSGRMSPLLNAALTAVGLGVVSPALQLLSGNAHLRGLPKMPEVEPTGGEAQRDQARAIIDQLREKAQADLAAAQKRTAETLAEQQKGGFLGRKGDPNYDRKLAHGGIVGIEDLSRSIQEAILANDYPQRTAAATERTATATEKIASAIGNAAMNPLGAVASAAVFAAP